MFTSIRGDSLGQPIRTLIRTAQAEVRATDLTPKGKLKKGIGERVLMRQRCRYGVNFPALWDGLNLESRLQRPKDRKDYFPNEPLERRRRRNDDASKVPGEKIAKMRRAGGNRPSVSLEEVLTNAGFRIDKLEFDILNFSRALRDTEGYIDFEMALEEDNQRRGPL